MNYMEVTILSLIEPQNFSPTNKNEYQVNDADKELNQIQKNQTWEYVLRSKDKNVIGTKQVYGNKLDENGLVRNKVRIICKGYVQVEGIAFDEIFAIVAHWEAIRMFMYFSCFKRFKVYQVDVKSTFLN